MKIPILIVLIGIPKSGKTTLAKHIIETSPKQWVRISRDDIENSQFKSIHYNRSESLITSLVYAQVKTLLEQNVNVILDTCNCKEEELNQILQDYSHLAEIQFKVIDTSLTTCLERNKLEENFTSSKMIYYINECLTKTKQSFDFSNRDRINKQVCVPFKDKIHVTDAIICDIDGTLSFSEHRDWYSPKEEEILEDRVSEQVRMLLQSVKIPIIIVSGREDTYKNITEVWLKKHDIPYDEIHMRKSGDNRCDTIVKKEILDELKYNILYCIDDRKKVKQMWVDNGIFVFDVNQHDIIF